LSKLFTASPRGLQVAHVQQAHYLLMSRNG
jgi:hypothetical protein